MKFVYCNHRGEVRERNIEADALVYDRVLHPDFGYNEPAWYLRGIDPEKGVRSFKLSNIVLPDNVPTYVIYLPPRFSSVIS